MAFYQLAGTQTQARGGKSRCACQVRWGPQFWALATNSQWGRCSGFTGNDSKTERACLWMLGVASLWPAGDLSLWVSHCHCHHSWWKAQATGRWQAWEMQRRGLVCWSSYCSHLIWGKCYHCWLPSQGLGSLSLPMGLPTRAWHTFHQTQLGYFKKLFFIEI